MKEKIQNIKNTVATEISTFLTNDISYQSIPKQMLEKIIRPGITYANVSKVQEFKIAESFKDCPCLYMNRVKRAIVRRSILLEQRL